MRMRGTEITLHACPTEDFEALLPQIATQGSCEIRVVEPPPTAGGGAPLGSVAYIIGGASRGAAVMRRPHLASRRSDSSILAAAAAIDPQNSRIGLVR